MITFVPSWAMWLIIFVVPFGFGLWQARRKDLWKQREKFRAAVQKADAEMRPEGWIIATAELRHGVIFGHGRVTWRHPRIEGEAHMEVERL